MSANDEPLGELLPALYRLRDPTAGHALEALLDVIGSQVDVVRADIERLYDNWFIETCDDWVVPYIGDLIGYEPVHEAGEPGAVDTPQGRARNRVLVPRREVARTIGSRRRKGTLALLEDLALDVAGWPARAVEFYRLLVLRAALNAPRPRRGHTVDLRGTERFPAMDRLDRLGGPFDDIARTVDIRRPGSPLSPGRHNIPSVVVFVWRLRPYSVTRTPAYQLEDQRDGSYTFSVLANDAPLFTEPEPEPGVDEDPRQIAGERNVPAPIRRRALLGHVDDFYGPQRSFAIWVREGRDREAGDESEEPEPEPIPAAAVVVADLAGWSYLPQGGQVAVDPERGRLAFDPERDIHDVWVSYRYGFSTEIGGGEYERTLREHAGSRSYGVAKHGDAPFDTIGAALEQWRADGRPDAVVELRDSESYTEVFAIDVPAGRRLQLRAADRTRPVIRLLDYGPGRRDPLHLRGGADSEIVLDGLLVAGRPVRLDRGAGKVRLAVRHCTLVPGWTLEGDCNPCRPTEPSLQVLTPGARVVVEHSIVGSIQAVEPRTRRPPVELHISDSVLDATSRDEEALTAPGGGVAHATVSILRSTVFGVVRIDALRLAENSIFEGRVHTTRAGWGCVRFCSVTPGSHTPRRYACQPDLAEAAATDAAERERAQARVRPRFTSVRYGHPAYCQLADSCPVEIVRGADDESEMGVFHDLFQPQREANLHARLDEYTPVVDTGVVHAT